MTTLIATHSGPRRLESLAFRRIIHTYDIRTRPAVQLLFRCLPQRFLPEILKLVSLAYSPDDLHQAGGCTFTVAEIEHLQGIGRDARIVCLLNAISGRCSTLTEIHLPHCILPPEHLCMLLTHLPKLRSVDLLSTQCDGSVLKCMGEHCLNLTDLCLGICCRVSDSAVKYLCGDQADGGVGCLNLRTLDLSRSHVTERGVGRLLLKLPKLSSLISEHTTKAVSSLLDDDPLSVFSLQLSRLQDDRTLSNEQFLACACCLPHLSSLMINHLNLDGDQPHRWSILQSILSPIGENLTKLSLGLCTVAANRIYTSCPKLESLSLILVHLILATLPSDPGSGHKLQQLFLYDCTGLTNETLFPLVARATSLEYLSLQGNGYAVSNHTNTLTDEAFTAIKAVNPLKRLRKVRLSRWPRLTMQAIRLLLPPCGQLDKLLVDMCPYLDDYTLLEETNQLGWSLLV